MHVPARAAGCLAATAAAALAFPAAARAHGIVGQTDLPVPAWLFGWAACLVLVISFVALATLWREPRLRGPGIELMRIPRVLDPLLGAAGVALFALIVVSGLAGTQNPTANLAPTMVYVAFWVGIPFVSVLAGDVFRPLNPWRALARGAAWIAGRVAPGVLPSALPYPRRLGRWPAALTLAAFGWLELVAAGGDDPQLLAALALAYAAVQLLGMSLFGIEPWTGRADGFAVAFRFVASLAPLAAEHGRLVARAPLAGALRIEPVRGDAAVLVAWIGTTTFDGAGNSSLWVEAQPWLQARAADMGLAATSAAELSFTIGLAVAIAVAALVFRIGAAGLRARSPGTPGPALRNRFAATLVPIAFAYVVAHYLSLLAFQGQALPALLSDPLGTGADLLGTAHVTADPDVLPPTAIWYLQVAALVAGHVAGLVLAHERALAIWRSHRDAARSQLWMLAVMVGYTSLGLWLLSAVAT